MTNDMELKSTPLCFQVLFKAQVFCNQIESYYVLTSSLSFIQESVWCCHDYLHGSTKVAFSRDLTLWKVFLKHENLYRLSFPKSYTIWPSTMNLYYIIGQGKGNRNKWHFLLARIVLTSELVFGLIIIMYLWCTYSPQLHSSGQCYKTYFVGNLDLHKIKKLKKMP